MSEIGRRGLCLVLAGPSGGGKTSIARALLADDPSLRLSVSVTTRPPRPGERDGIDYQFLDADEFELMRQQGELLEWAQVLGRYYYGSPRTPVVNALAQGHDMLFDIDWQGFRSLRAALPDDVVGIFLLPPTLAALRDRLIARGGDNPAEIARRMDRARGEIRHCTEFDHVIVNDTFDHTATLARAILAASRTEIQRLSGLPATLSGLGL